MTTNSYLFRSQWDQEYARLTGLAATFDATTTRHLTLAGVSAGWHCLEVGAGTGTIARWLATAVGPDGRVVATDRDVTFLDDLRSSVEVREHDVTTDPLEEDAFDLVHCRALVQHLPDRDAVIARLVRALRPGGVLVLEEGVCGGPSARMQQRSTLPAASAEALNRVFDATAGGFRSIGAEPEYGLDVPAVLRRAGLVDVDGELTYRLVHGGSPEAAFFELTIRQIGARLIGAGLLTAEDEETVLSMTADPTACWLSIGLFSATGRRP
ncbi:class I SAM-dependent methyltransferase [Cryptosporangium sp. NPDC048952]|uniref:class I SAM-dependent methyltransferase n=1 Tax=Cryptosporangium sp. NPDC048952 TaxID=3363961 RepID=UPI00371952DD